MKWLPWLIFALFGFFLVGNNFSAKLGMIDDHEIAMFLGSDGKVKVSEFVPTLMNTEVGQWGTFLRYRPSYYTLRVLETAMWRDNAFLWYFSRYLMLVISLWLGWKILTTYFPKIVSYLFVFYIMTIPLWSDVLTRLGPSEIYAVPALLLFVYGIMKNKLWMIVLGYMVCIGAKENFLFLFPILLMWSGIKIYTKKLSRNDLLATLLMTAYTLFIVGAIYVATSKTGADIYGAQISYSERFALLYKYKRYIVESRHLQLPILITMAAFVKVAIIAYRQGVQKLVNNTLFKHLVVLGIVGMAIATQYIFYNSQIPNNMRYDYPVMILFPVFQLTSLSLLIAILPKKIFRISTPLIVYICLGVILFSFITKRGYYHIQNRALINSQATQSFDINLLSFYKVATENPDSTFVFVSNKFFAYEPMISVARYLTAKKVINKMVISYTPEPNVVDPLGIELESLITASMNGESNDDKSFERFSPISSIGNSCFSITFGDAAPLPDCPTIAKF